MRVLAIVFMLFSLNAANQLLTTSKYFFGWIIILSLAFCYNIDVLVTKVPTKYTLNNVDSL